MQEKKNKDPFADIGGQQSPAILEIIAVVKNPLLEIYSVGAGCECSHYKHLVRLTESILLTKKGEPITFLFDEVKTQKTIDNFKNNKPSVLQKKQVSQAWIKGLKALDEIADAERDEFERFIFWLVYDIFMVFAGGSVNIRKFHRDKQSTVAAFNYVIANKPEVPKFKTKFERNQVLRKAGVPVVA
jgi:hypothetical protein